MTSLSKISPLAHINYAIKAVQGARSHVANAAKVLPEDEQLSKIAKLLDGVIPFLKQKSSSLYTVKRDRGVMVRPEKQLGYTLDDALDKAAITSDALRRRVKATIDVVINSNGIDYAMLTSGRREPRIAQAKKTLAIILREWLDIPANDIHKLLSISVNTVNYHIRTWIPQDTDRFEDVFTRIKNGEYFNEH